MNHDCPEDKLGTIYLMLKIPPILEEEIKIYSVKRRGKADGNLAHIQVVKDISILN